MLAYPYPDLADSHRRDSERRAERHRLIASLGRKSDRR